MKFKPMVPLIVLQVLYQHDAACRVIARLMRERDEARAMVSQRQGQMAEAAAKA